LLASRKQRSLFAAMGAWLGLMSKTTPCVPCLRDLQACRSPASRHLRRAWSRFCLVTRSAWQFPSPRFLGSSRARNGCCTFDITNTLPVGQCMSVFLGAQSGVEYVFSTDVRQRTGDRPSLRDYCPPRSSLARGRCVAVHPLAVPRVFLESATSLQNTQGGHCAVPWGSPLRPQRRARRILKNWSVSCTQTCFWHDSPG